MRVKKGERIILLVLAVVVLLIALVLNASAQAEQAGCLWVSEVAWAGTNASSFDEWYEVWNECGQDVDTTGWYLETTRPDGTTVTATMPIATIIPGGYALFERTDDQTVSNITADGIHGGQGTGGSLTGIFINTGLSSFAIKSGDGGSYHIIFANGDLEWPAGNATARASMMLVNGQWVTATGFGTGLDANNQPILGSPADANETGGQTCGILPVTWDWDLGMDTFEDQSFQPTVSLEATLFGVDENGVLFETSGFAQVVWIYPSSGIGNGWEIGEFVVEEGTSPECEAAMHTLQDATANVLRHQPSGVADQHPEWPAYADWLNAILRFQKSGAWCVGLPNVVNGD